MQSEQGGKFESAARYLLRLPNTNLHGLIGDISKHHRHRQLLRSTSLGKVAVEEEGEKSVDFF